MISEIEAKENVYHYINQPNPDWDDKPELVITDIEDKGIAWVFYYNSSKWLQTKDWHDALAGNGPIIISKATGELFTIGTSAGIEERLQEKLKELTLQTD